MKRWSKLLSLTLGINLVALVLNSCQSTTGSGSQNAAYSQPAAGGSDSRVSKAMQRPGLGTQAGSEVVSAVEDTTFYRKTVGAPDAVDSFHYNDDEGAKAMLGGKDSSISKHSGRFEAANGAVSVALVQSYGWYNSSSGDTLPWLTSKSAPGRKVVVGTSGSNYAISLENKTKHRIEVVASVDGLDVLDAGSASVNKRGYILAAGQKMNIQGFRKNSNSVKQFQFGSVRDSAAAKKSEAAARNVGVIGLAVWQEDQLAARQAQQLEAQHRTQANPFGGPVSAR
jgi:hypothetical protein